jgi:hypothetical protein
MIKGASDAIKLLPEDRRPKARDLFHRFAKGFNLGLPRVEYIYQCNENPFIGEDKELDLSGMRLARGSKMNAKTPITFSLPSMLQGTNDAAGLCTIRVLDVMVETQNELLFALAQRDEPDKPQVQIETLPVTHFQTPPELLRRQVIHCSDSVTRVDFA